jgi:GDPmannose 4,6-dehydratase
LAKPIKFLPSRNPELYGSNSGEKTQNESTPFYPRSLTLSCKLFTLTDHKNYRESLITCLCQNGILNHCSLKMRGAQIGLSKQKIAVLLSPYATKPKNTFFWQHHKTRLRPLRTTHRAMWLPLQHSIPDDFVVATRSIMAH